MPQRYTIQQGDHASRIAEQFGFGDFATIWNDAANADLRAQRGNPHVLFPGDQLTVPDKQSKTAPADTSTTSEFRLHRQALRLRLQVTDQDENPIANTPCELAVDGAAKQLQTGPDGTVSQPIARSARNATLRLLGVELPVKIGDLDPVEQLSGQYARLNNLGYFAGEPNAADDLTFRSAVEEFQCDNGLPVNGVCDAATQASLQQVHGC